MFNNHNSCEGYDDIDVDDDGCEWYDTMLIILAVVIMMIIVMLMMIVMVVSYSYDNSVNDDDNVDDDNSHGSWYSPIIGWGWAWYEELCKPRRQLSAKTILNE